MIPPPSQKLAGIEANPFLNYYSPRSPRISPLNFQAFLRPSTHMNMYVTWTFFIFFSLVFSTGVMAFLGLAGFFMSRPLAEIQLEEKLVFMCFFAGAIVCMGLSFLYHTLCCHKDKKIGRLFAKFDYCGIAFLTVCT